jgi:hypothetical protein
MTDTTSIEFLNGTGLAVLSGASLAVTVITNTVQALSKRSSPWVPFIASLAIVGVVTLASKSSASDAMTWLLAFINACLLFCTAAGIQGVIGHVTPRTQDHPLDPPVPPAKASFASRWTQSWLRPQTRAST